MRVLPPPTPKLPKLGVVRIRRAGGLAPETNRGTHVAPTEPIGLQVMSAAQSVSGALDRALTAAGGSLRMWFILVAASGKDQRHGAHMELSAAIGGDALALSDDIPRLEVAGLVVRRTDPQDPRESRVELTESGRALFHRLLRVVIAYDAQLRLGITPADMEVLSRTLKRLRGNGASADAS